MKDESRFTFQLLKSWRKHEKENRILQTHENVSLTLLTVSISQSRFWVQLKAGICGHKGTQVGWGSVHGMDGRTHTTVNFISRGDLKKSDRLIPFLL